MKENKGVNKGIESFSKILMPILFLLVICIAVFLLTIKHTAADGTVRTGLEGFKIYLIPNLEGVTVKQFFTVVVDAMGGAGHVIGFLFFAMVLFAILTSSVSIMEAVAASLMDQFHMSRTKAVLLETAITLVFAVVVCLGYNVFFFNMKLPNGVEAQVLDLMDYISNNLLMPIVAIGTCILIGWVLKPKTMIDEVEKGGFKFGRRKLYVVMIKFIAPALF